MKTAVFTCRFFLFFLFFQTAGIVHAQGSEIELKEKADLLFKEERFVEATSLFLQLIALDPRSSDYNFKYGTCLLFNSQRKQDAFKYLNFSVTDPTIVPEAYFYLGKAFHLIYKFDDAIVNYKKYLSLVGSKPNPNFDTDRQIQMCENGKKLLSAIFDIIVLDKKEIENASFFRLYNLSNIGGVILVNAEYQSKLDKKKNHVPLIHFPDKANIVYYSSYGLDGKNQKDIYYRERTSDGSWSLPQLVGGQVNTPYDEDFPYRSADGKYLYFSSKGHNSMGGYDIFRAKIDPRTGMTGEVENLDFPISSPDNDLFYVVDSLEQNAYFSSARQSTNGKIHVYKVRVERIPVKLDETNPEDLLVTIQAKSELNINADKFDLKALDAQKNDRKVLADVGLENASNQQIIEKFEQIQQKQQFKADAILRLEIGAINKINNDATEIEKLQAEIKSDLAKADNSDSKVLKAELIQGAEQKLNQIIALKEEIEVAKSFSDSISSIVPQELAKEKQLQQLTSQIRAAVVNDQFSEVKSILTSNQKLIKEVTADNESNPIESLTKQNEGLKKEQEPLLKQQNEYKANQTTLKNEIAGLNNALSSAKPKEKTEISSKIQSKEAELALLDEEIKRLEKKLDALKQQEAENQKRIVFLNEMQHNTQIASVSKQIALDKSTSVLNQLDLNTLKEQVNQHVASLKIDSEAVKTDVQPNTSELTSWQNNFEQEKQTLNSNTELNSDEKNALMRQKADAYEQQLTDALKTQETALKVNPNDQQAQKNSESIRQALAKLQQEKQAFVNDDQASKTTDKPIVDTQQVVEKPLVTSPEEQLTAINPTYNKQVEEAEKNQNTETKYKALIALDEQVVDDVMEKLDGLYNEIAKDPLNESLQNQKDALLELKQQKEESLAENKAILENISDENESIIAAMTPEKELAKLLPDYEKEKMVLQKSDSVVALEALNQLDQQAIKSIDQALDELKNEQDPVSVKKRELLLESKQQIAEDVKVRTEKLQAIAPPKTDPKAELITALKPDFEQQIQQIKTQSTDKKTQFNALLDQHNQLLNAIQLELNNTSKSLVKSPDDSKLIERKTQLEALKESTNIQVKVFQDSATILAKNEVNKEMLRQELLPEYTDFVATELIQATPEQLESLKLQEEKLQTQIQKQIVANNKVLQKKFDAEKSAQNEVLKSLMQESIQNTEELKGAQSKQSVEPTTQPELSEVLKTDFDFVMTQEPTSFEMAEKQLQALNELHENLNLKLSEIDAKVPNAKENKAKIEQQITAVEARQQTVKDAIQSFNQVVEHNPEKPETNHSTISKIDQTTRIDSLNRVEMELTNALTQAEGKQRQSLEKQLASTKESKQLAERIQQEINTAASKQVAQENRTELVQLNSNEPLKNTVLARTEFSTNKDELKYIEDATLISSAVTALEAQKIQSETGQVVHNEQRLQAAKRRFLIEIGILQKEMDLPNLDESMRNQLSQEKATIEQAVARLDQQIQELQQQMNIDLLQDPRIKAPISREDEIRITSHEKYPEWRSKQVEINRMKLQVNELNEQLSKLRDEFSTENDSVEKLEIIAEIVQASQKRQELQNSIAAQEREIAQSVKAIGENSVLWENVLIREVPVQTQSVASLKKALEPSIANGFEIRKPNEQIATQPVVKAIPIGIKAPSGLVFRVQVGAFAKPIPADLFKEFTPVTGEKLDNGITRYLAGYFSDEQSVLKAQQAIRGFGYNDAFVVAYCDGKRISLAEARILIAKNECKPMVKDSMVLELIENTIAQLPEETKAQYKTEPKISDYNKAPGAAEAIAIEEIQGLFYTVQVGVYNRPATQEQLFFIQPLVTRRLENGQIRYSTGTFRSVDEARPTKQAVIEKGITDAFITAYYKGERISLKEAADLQTKYGDTILVNLDQLPVIEKQVVSEKARLEYIQENPAQVQTIQHEKSLVSKKMYETYPEKEMRQLRLQGQFYYDQNDQRIKSVVSDNVPAVINSMVVFDTLVQEKVKIIDGIEPNKFEVVAVWDKNKLDGAWGNWLVRLTQPYRLIQTTEQIELRISVQDAVQKSKVEALVLALHGMLKN